ncbi:MAG: DNA integrity scanning protein DisA nucleotide-binding domain protein [Phycisphaerae bacterium]|nr:DNA integrity scanning protein DisA nucleotide-binding domain protein [Phycisphaerae bacterium]
MDNEQNIESRTDKGQARARGVTQSLLAHVEAIAGSCQAAAIFVYADAIDAAGLPVGPEFESKVHYITKTAEEDEAQNAMGRRVLHVPNVPLTRMGQVKVALFLALSRGIVDRGDTVVFLSGIAASKSLDTLIVTEIGREHEMYMSGNTEPELPAEIRAEVVERLVEIASELGQEGREGRHVGALFVVGDTERVRPLTRQLILNPFRGYSDEERNILDPQLEETVKEMSTLDGAFIISGKGVIETCGAYLKTASQQEYDLPRGLGARHHAAAAITAVTDSIAITVSASTGTVTVFRHGGIVTEIEKPGAVDLRPRTGSRPSRADA